jgi:hypothetical protein
VTLCKAYLGIEPLFDLWNYFFRAQLRSGSDVEAAVRGQCGHLGPIRVQSQPVLPPFNVQPSGWVVERMFFFLRNDVDEPLPVFTGNHPIPQLNWGYDVAQR